MRCEIAKGRGRGRPAPRHAARCPRRSGWGAAAMLLLLLAAGWANSRDWAAYYARLGAAQCMADCAAFSQSLSLIPPFAGPLALLVSLLQQAGGRRAILRFGSRAAYWQAVCRAAAARAALFAGALVLGASLAGLGMAGVNWGRPGSLFAQTAGGPLAQPPGLGAVCGALWAAAALQLLALQLLWGLLSCRLRPLAALVGVLAADLALCSPVRPEFWLQVCCGAACWARPGGPALRLAGWLACCGGLYLLGRLAWRRADVL